MVRVYTALWDTKLKYKGKRKSYFPSGLFHFLSGIRLYASLRLSPIALVLSLRTPDWTRCDCGIWSISVTAGWRGLKMAASEKVWKKLWEKGNVSGLGPRESRQDGHNWSLPEILMAQRFVSIIFLYLAWLRVDKSTQYFVKKSPYKPWALEIRTKALLALSGWAVVIMHHLVQVKAITASHTSRPKKLVNA